MTAGPHNSSSVNARWHRLAGRPVTRLARQLPGPEDVAFDPYGAIYTGLSDGRIVRLPQITHRGEQSNLRPDEAVSQSAADAAGDEGPDLMHVTVASTHGRPLGLRFHPANVLIIADAERGLLAMSPDGTVRTLMAGRQHTGHHLVNAVAIDGNHDIIFTVSSTRYALERMMGCALTDETTGKVMRYDWQAQRVETVATGLNFANGIALSEDGRYAWVAETFRRRIVGVSLDATGPVEPEPCVTDLPGYPDNLDRDDTGLLWGALFAPPNRALETLRNRPGIAKAVARLTGGRQLIKAPRDPRAFAYDPEQHALEAITFEAPRPYAPLTTVRRVGQRLYLASIEQSTLAIAALPAELSAFTDTAAVRDRSG